MPAMTLLGRDGDLLADVLSVPRGSLGPKAVMDADKFLVVSYTEFDVSVPITSDAITDFKFIVADCFRFG